MVHKLLQENDDTRSRIRKCCSDPILYSLSSSSSPSSSKLFGRGRSRVSSFRGSLDEMKDDISSKRGALVGMKKRSTRSRLSLRGSIVEMKNDLSKRGALVDMKNRIASSLMQINPDFDVGKLRKSRQEKRDQTNIFQDVTEEEEDNNTNSTNYKFAIMSCCAIVIMSILFREPRFLRFIVILPLAKMVEIYFKWVTVMNERKSVKTRAKFSLVHVFYNLTHPWQAAGQNNNKDPKRFLSSATRLVAVKIATSKLEKTLSAESLRMSSSDLNKLLIKETEEKLQSYRDIHKFSGHNKARRQVETDYNGSEDDDAVYF